MIPTVSRPLIEPDGECRRCGAPVERFTWTFTGSARHSQHRCAAGHIYVVITRR